MERGEGEVLELPLDRVDPEAVRQRGEDLERLPSLLLLLLLRERADRAHVVEAVGQLDQDHPDVGGHRDHHLAVVLGLPLVAALEGDLGELGDAVDQLRDLIAEVVADLVEAGAGVLDRVVEERRAERRGVEAKAGADPRHAEGVGDEVLAGLALLARVALAGEGEGALDLLAVDGLRGVGLCSSITAKRSPSRARWSAVSSRVIESARGVLDAADGLSDAGVAAAIRIAHGTVAGEASPLSVSVTPVLLLAGIGWPPGVWRDRPRRPGIAPDRSSPRIRPAARGRRDRTAIRTARARREPARTGRRSRACADSRRRPRGSSAGPRPRPLPRPRRAPARSPRSRPAAPTPWPRRRSVSWSSAGPQARWR